MLVLTRKTNEQVSLGDDITITILRINNGSIRIGIDAPRHVRILRSEIDPHPVREGKPQAADQAVAEGTAELQATATQAAETGQRLEINLDQHEAAALQSLLETSEAGTEPARIYQMRTTHSTTDKISQPSQPAKSRQPHGRNSADRNTASRPAPLSRFLPPIPPAVQESTPGYAV
ncbi:carbon storage regulator [Planctomycetaceae bacterium SH139]